MLCVSLGCRRVGVAPALPTPIGLEVMRAAPELKIQRFSTLLDFESPADAAFVVASGGAKLVTMSDAHSGSAALVGSDAARQLLVRLDSVLGTRPFPGNWLVVGGYARASRDSRIDVELLRDGRLLRKSTVTLPAGRWTAAMVDVTGLPPGEGPLVLEFARSEAASAIELDDVMLVDNTQTLLAAGPMSAMTLKQRGLRLIAELPGRPPITLDTLQASPAGWEAVETNPLRLRFSGGGTTRSLVVHASGATFWDGRIEAPGNRERDRVAAHRSPATVQVRDDSGRLVRADPGDANNDGYNETRGAYILEAAGPRITAEIRPSVPLESPAFEVRGLPPGDVIVTLDGRAIEAHVRLGDGTLLIELPLRIEQPVELYVAVR